MDVLAALGQPPLLAHLDKSWTAHTTAKSGMYEAQALLSSGDAFHADDQVASEITRLRVLSQMPFWIIIRCRPFVSVCEC